MVEAGYRLIRSEHVDGLAILESGLQATADVVSDTLGDIIIAEDTTTLSFEHELAGAGPLGGPKNSGQGIWVHSALAVSAADRQIHGLLHQSYWVRDASSAGKRHQRRERPYEEKESYKWEATSRAIASRLSEEAMARTVFVCDREADVLEYLSYKRENGQRFVVRSSWNRKVLGGGNVRDKHNLTRRGSIDVELRQRGGRHARSARVAHCDVFTRTVSLSRQRDGAVGPGLVGLVHVYEVDPPPGAKRLEWWLYTSDTVADFTSACRVVDYYRLRWLIEDFHKAWKSGTKIEELRLHSVENLLRIAPVLAHLAARLLQLRALRDEVPDLSSAALLSDTHRQVLWLSTEQGPPPEQPPTITWVWDRLARLGGWGDTKGTGQPSWIPLMRGALVLEERVAGWLLAIRAQSQGKM